MAAPGKDLPEGVPRPQRMRARWVRLLPLAGLAAVFSVVVFNGWHRLLTLETIVHVRDSSLQFITDHFLLALLAYVAVYSTAVAFSIPVALIMTLTGGLMFGALVGGAAAVTGSSIGAILLFLVARSAFGETLRSKAGPSIARLVDGFRRDALNYLLFLRLVPIVPFFVVNIAAALLGVPPGTYVLGTVFGVMPAAFAFASVGAGLDSIVAAAKAEQAACIAAKSAALCPFGLTAKSLATKEILTALTLLGLLALIPVAYKTWNRRNGMTRNG